MRTLALILYLTVLGFLLVISFLVEQIGGDYYAKELGSNYIEYTHKVTPVIEKALLTDSDNASKVLQTWSEIISEGNDAIELVELTAPLGKAKVLSVEFDEQTDEIYILSPLQSEHFVNKALKIRFIDAYSDDVINLVNSGYVIIYLLMAVMLTVVAWVIYRYISRISKVTESVAAGSFDLRMPDSRIPALKKLAEDINTMTDTIAEKTTDNLILTGAIHHELRIPITRIRLALDMAVGSNQDEFLQELLSGMDDDLEELSALMEELLTISRLRLKGLSPDKAPVHLREILTNVCQDINNPMIVLNEIAAFELKANHTLLERALHNIISNAVKYAKSTVLVEAKVINDNQSSQYTITVADDGPGIPEDERRLILKPFYRIDKSRNRTTGGFGLGLAIADMVLKETHGTIDIGQSTLHGAEFKISWRVNHTT